MRIALDCTPSAASLGHGIGVYARHLAFSLARIAGGDDRFDLAFESHKWHARVRGIPEIDTRFTHRRLWPLPVRFGWASEVGVFHGLDARLPRTRFPREVVTFHDMYPFHRYLWEDGDAHVVRYHEKRLLRYPRIAERAAAIICVSRNTRDDLLRIAPAAGPKILVIHHGTDAGDPGRVPDDDDVSPTVREAAYGRYFVHVGTLWRIRNLPATVRAFARVARAHPDVRLVLVGDRGEDTDEVRRLASEHRIESAILLLGMLPEREKLYLVSRAVALLMFHLYAGFGLPVVEAMALGVPVLASDRGALPEIGGDAAIYTRVDDEEGMAAAMTGVLDDRELRARLAENGRRRSREFTWDSTARATYGIYRRLAETI
ncbi:MAG: glycosyltransferase family 4 protein [Acidobacteriia bacterium]|nr:glycosyltransferase family 4 protein [Terriglobia bacterium]